MIVGVFIRYIKTYSGINYIPLSNGETFCGLVGNNGIGKSSVLEALDCYFNDQPWNLNVATKKSGTATIPPHIVPVILVDFESIHEDHRELAKKLSDTIWTLEDEDVTNRNRPLLNNFKTQLEELKRTHDQEKYALIPLGSTHDGLTNISIFNTKKIGEKLFDNVKYDSGQIPQEKLDEFKSLRDSTKKIFEYIYIPKDINPEQFTKLETVQIQSLMGETLNQILQKCIPTAKIQEINSSLNKFLDGLSDKLIDYSFRTPTDRQQNLRKGDVYSLVVEAFFNIRKLHKSQGDQWLEMRQLSSGEKQKAIIDLATNLLKNYRRSTDNIILAIDEPEASLHMSACYDQFNNLYEISDCCRQFLFTTHWYGFIPTVERGYVTVITKSEGEHNIDLINIASFRESVKQQIQKSKGKLPYDIRLKSLNDFIQSIITSILNDEPFNWLICEGSSEKIYLEKYFEDVKVEKKLRIIPVGGAGEIKRIYNHIIAAYEDFKKEVKGKVIMISDTDPQLVSYNTRDDLTNLICLRLVNDNSDRETKLVKINSNPVSPKTEVEDALNGKLFIETLLEFKADYPELEFLDEITIYKEEPSYFALDLSPSKQQKLESFFDKDNNKFRFANKYVEKITKEYSVPKWIQEIKSKL